MTQPPPRTDGQLLAQYYSDQSQAAFTELVNRHGAMVHGVALRVLADHHEAQDVAQAVFLTLARKASALRRSESVGGWLHTVAWRAAMDVQRARRSRQQREDTVMRERPLESAAAPPDAGLFRAELDAAVSDLPERYRQPLVLFHLEGRSLAETSQAMRLNLNTLSTRLARARDLLRQKLVRRGVTVGSVGALTALLSAESGAAVLPPAFVASTVSAATGGAISTTVAALTKGVLHMLLIAKVKTVSLAAAACLVVAGSGVVAAKQRAATSSPVAGPLPTNQPAVKASVSSTAPAQTPSSAPAGAKYAHPQQACATLLQAFASRDPSALAEATAAPTAEWKATFCRVMPVMYAMADLSQVSLTKFDETQVRQQALYLQGDRLKEWISHVPRALVQITGDTATVDFTKVVDGQVLEQLPFGPKLEFRREKGEWKFWVAREPNRREVRLAQSADQLEPALRALIRDVEQGRYASAAEVRDAMKRTVESVIPPEPRESR